MAGRSKLGKTQPTTGTVPRLFEFQGKLFHTSSDPAKQLGFDPRWNDRAADPQEQIASANQLERAVGLNCWSTAFKPQRMGWSGLE